MYAAVPGHLNSRPLAGPFLSQPLEEGLTSYRIGMTTTEGLLAQQSGNVTSYNTTPANTAKFDVNDIVMHFGREYYTMLSCEPERLHCFYGKQSSLLHCQEEETDAAVCVGLEEIHQRLTSMGYNGARVVIGNIDCQPSMNGGILIFVLGTMHWPTGVVRKFAQTFLLAEQPNGYFVLNDILRILSDAEPTKATIMEKKTKATACNNCIASSSPEPAVTVAVEKQAALPPTTTKAEPVKEKSGKQQTKKNATLPTTPVKSPKVECNKEEVEEEQPTTATTPSSWAKLAAVQQNRWQSGVVAESKGPVVSIPVEGEKPLQNGSSRVNYRTNGGDRRERRDQQQPLHQDQPSQGSYDRPHRERRPVVEFDAAKALYVHNISGRIDRDSLREKFKVFGPIKNFDAVVSKSIAFVEFETIEARDAALAVSIEYNNAPMTVEPRRSLRKDQSPREGNNRNEGQQQQQQRRHYNRNHNSNNNSNSQQPRE